MCCDTCRTALGQRRVVREVSGNGAFWMEPWIEVKRPGAAPVVYGPLEAGRRDRGRQRRPRRPRDRRPRRSATTTAYPPLGDHPFFKDQLQIISRNAGVIEPDSIEDAIARGAYDGYFKVLFEMSAEEAIAEVTAAQRPGPGRRRFPRRHQVGKRPQGARHARSSWSATATKASPTSTRIATCTNAIRTASSKASSSPASSAAPSVATTTSAASTRWRSGDSARPLPTPNGSA